MKDIKDFRNQSFSLLCCSFADDNVSIMKMNHLKEESIISYVTLIASGRDNHELISHFKEFVSFENLVISILSGKCTLNTFKFYESFNVFDVDYKVLEVAVTAGNLEIISYLLDNHGLDPFYTIRPRTKDPIEPCYFLRAMMIADVTPYCSTKTNNDLLSKILYPSDDIGHDDHIAISAFYLSIKHQHLHVFDYIADNYFLSNVNIDYLFIDTSSEIFERLLRVLEVEKGTIEDEIMKKLLLSKPADILKVLLRYISSDNVIEVIRSFSFKEFEVTKQLLSYEDLISILPLLFEKKDFSEWAFSFALEHESHLSKDTFKEICCSFLYRNFNIDRFKYFAKKCHVDDLDYIAVYSNRISLEALMYIVSLGAKVPMFSLVKYFDINAVKYFDKMYELDWKLEELQSDIPFEINKYMLSKGAKMISGLEVKYCISYNDIVEITFFLENRMNPLCLEDVVLVWAKMREDPEILKLVLEYSIKQVYSPKGKAPYIC